MPREKSTDTESLLTRTLVIRVNEKTFTRLEKMCTDSGCSSIAEIVRRIISGKKITLFHKDISMNGPMEELAMIRRELRAIGVNINQVTRHFNQDKEGTRRAYYVMQVADLYKRVGTKVEEAIPIIEQLAEKWLRRS